MGAYTWTFVKSSAMPKEMINTICDRTIRDISNIWYYKEAKNDYASALEKWLAHHKKRYNYYVNECGVNPNELTPSFLENELAASINKKDAEIADLEKVKAGQMTFTQFVRAHKSCISLCRKYKRHIYVKIPSEIFRLREYSDLTVSTGIKTVDDLIKYLSQPQRQSQILWYDKDTEEECAGLTPKLEAKIREFYSQFGDNNFSVSFG